MKIPLILGLVFTILVLSFTASLMLIASSDKSMIRYDCRLAEISPDFTPSMKQQCREKLKRN